MDISPLFFRGHPENEFRNVGRSCRRNDAAPVRKPEAAVDAKNHPMHWRRETKIYAAATGFLHLSIHQKVIHDNTGVPPDESETPTPTRTDTKTAAGMVCGYLKVQQRHMSSTAAARDALKDALVVVGGEVDEKYNMPRVLRRRASPAAERTSSCLSRVKRARDG